MKDGLALKALRRGIYRVSKDGRVFRCGDPERELSQYALRTGYKFVTLFVDGDSLKCAVHRLVALRFLGRPPRYLEINHLNGIKDDNRLENLEWCTSKENCDHAFENGLSNIGASGEAHNNAKLTDREADIIRKIWRTGRFSKVEIAEIYSVVPGTIAKICKGLRKTKGDAG